MKRKNGFHVVLLSLLNQFAPLGINSLHVVLKKAGFKCSLVLFKELENPYSPDDVLVSEGELAALMEKLERLDPDLVGISLCSSFLKTSERITKRIQNDLKCPVIWGGIHPTLEPENCIRVADMVCRGEGEETLLELTRKMSSGQDFSSIKGLWVREKDRITRNGLRPLIQNLDIIPYPDFDLNDRHYLMGRNDDNPLYQPYYIIMSSRGCPFACTYCCNSAMKNIFAGSGAYVRRRTVDNVIGEIKIVKQQYNVNFIYFFDDVFAMDLEWVESFCRIYKREIGIPFMCYLHFYLITQELVDVLTDSGMSQAVLGIQSGSERVRTNYFARNTPDLSIVEASKFFLNRQKSRTSVCYHLIVDNPFENEKDKDDCLNLLSKLSPPYELDLFPLAYFPQSTLTNMALEQNIITRNDVDDMSEKAVRQYAVNFDWPRSEADYTWAATLLLISLVKKTPLIGKCGFLFKLVRIVRHRKRTIIFLLNVARHMEKVYLKASIYAVRFKKQQPAS